MSDTDFYSLAKKMLIREEGEKFRPYFCPAGFITIGIGHNLSANGISKEISDELFGTDLKEAIKANMRILGDSFASFSFNRRLALVNLLFNIGEASFLEFRATIKALREHNFSEASKCLLNSLYATQVPGRAHRIAEMIEKDTFPY